MADPLVSILIPTYNGERFLKRALASALDQSLTDIEVVVADDASTDSTPQILAAAAAADPRVRIIRHEENVGAYDNPRTLLEAARGEFVKFLLHDDLLMRDCVKELVRGMQATEGSTIAFSRRSIVGEDGRPLPDGVKAPLVDRAGPLDGRELGDLMLSNCVNVIGEMTTVLFRRADVDPGHLWEADGRRLAAMGDLYLWLSLLARGSAYYSPRTLSSFRLHGAQRSSDQVRVLRGALDWPVLVDWGRRAGFLADPAQQRAAFGKALRIAADNYVVLPPNAGSVAGLEATYLSLVALAELEGALPADQDRPLLERAHASDVLSALAAPFDTAMPD
ncbi:glycosyltransferase family 2 protein [Blastococcus sp. LR1]|uniref:glycosyltransferase family 2 protein n=1 Tax=Blastococcus sp. LR1 TaxID=2877000 RepID=UPI001CCDD1A9|nr:glycosyltransferase family 2 protein [Blastococcus sp. LR1]MCA0144467.1 glycosyltransferase [Blastococcus sp. LR1]